MITFNLAASVKYNSGQRGVVYYEVTRCAWANVVMDLGFPVQARLFKFSFPACQTGIVC